MKIETTAQEQGAAQAAKTFTQEEIDAIVSRRANRALKGVPNEEELNTYNTWRPAPAGYVIMRVLVVYHVPHNRPKALPNLFGDV